MSEYSRARTKSEYQVDITSAAISLSKRAIGNSSPRLQGLPVQTVGLIAMRVNVAVVLPF
jgi:hypothetical protein